MAQDLLHADARLLGVQQPQDQLHQPAAQLLLVQQRVVEPARPDVGDDLLQAAPRDRRLARGQHEEDDAQRPDVAALVVAAPQDLGGDVVGGAHQRVPPLLPHQLLPQIFIPLEGQPEVDEHQVQRLAVDQQEVFGLQVAVHHPVLVAVVDDAHHLREERPRVGLGEAALPLEPAEELAALAEAASLGSYSSTRKKLRSSSKVS